MLERARGRDRRVIDFGTYKLTHQDTSEGALQGSQRGLRPDLVDVAQSLYERHDDGR